MVIIRVKRLEDFIELVDRHGPVFLTVFEPLWRPGLCEVTVGGISKFGGHIVSVMFYEECNGKAGEECEEIVFNKVKRYLLNHFSKVYEGVITE